MKEIEENLARYRQTQHRGNVTAQNYVRDISTLLAEISRLEQELFRRNAECALLNSRLDLLGG